MTPDRIAASLTQRAARDVRCATSGEGQRWGYFDARAVKRLLQEGLVEYLPHVDPVRHRLTDLGIRVRSEIVRAWHEGNPATLAERADRLADELTLSQAREVGRMRPDLHRAADRIHPVMLRELVAQELLESRPDPKNPTKYRVRLTQPLGVAVWRRMQELKKRCQPSP